VNCETVQSDQVVERYVLGQLSEAEQGSFEEHFFACEACFEEVRLMQNLQAAGEGRPRPAVVLQMPRRNWAVWGAAAAAFVIALGLAAMWRTRQPAPPPAPVAAVTPSPELTLLAKIDPPRYVAANLRSSTSAAEEKFRAAMEKYSVGDYRVAAAGLRGLQTPAARFYLGISDLMTGSPDEAIASLRAVDAMGETPYLEQARFFLAKALLASQNVSAAKQALEQTIALAGDREAEARLLLERVRQLP